ncbi:hypothetical protein [Maribellus sediminis]|uniref:hypothetical protein n=1 Tax=Maribellus sediminis TaxID=2696285 RepID=UPI00142FB092|nr:hypothetical protein [Maribellus sediminis]
MKKLVVVSVFLLITLISVAQYFQTGQDPASIKWRQINTENFQLIYPDYYEDQAQVLTQKLEKVYDYASYSLKHKPSKISIILHTQTVKSNGLVAYAPKRSEFYTTPNQDIYPLDWLEQLAVHEFRHVVQIDKVNSELPAIVKILLGEQGTALVFGAYLPWWFIEGDAVATETGLSNFGRGRLPSFLMEHRAQLIEKGKYSYDKAYLGSYKDYVPNHYQLGYYLVGNTRQRYGADVWEKVMQRVGDKPFSLTPFNKALKENTGFGKVDLYNSIFDSLATTWNSRDFVQDEKMNYRTKSQKVYSSYTFNHWLENGDLLSYRTSLNRIPAFVKIDKNGQEQIIHQPGTIFDESINYHGEWIVWSEQIPDLRWSHSGRSLIRLLNVKSKKKMQIQPEFKAFAPALSPNLKQVAMVEADFSSNYFLSVYDLVTNELITRIQTPDNNYILSPQWLNADELVAIILTHEGKRLAKFSLKTGRHDLLFDHELGNIKQLVIKGNDLYFIASHTGVDALYFYNFKNGEIKQVYEPRFGVAYPAKSPNGKIVLSEYSAGGYRLIELEQSESKGLATLASAEYPLAGTIAKQEMGIPDLSVSDSITFPSKKYNKAKHLLNFHSWAPLFVDPYAYEFSPGVSVMSQNVLGTAETVLGYKWDTSEKTGQFYAHYIYKGWYPVLDFEASRGKRASNYSQITEYIDNNGNVVQRDTVSKRYTWNETNFSVSGKLPLVLSSGKYSRLFQPQVKYEYTSNSNDDSTPEGFPEGAYSSVSYRLYFHQLLRRSYQDVQPNFGFLLDGSYYHSPFGSRNMGSMIGGQSIIYLPGILANHGTTIYCGMQQRTNGNHYSFSDVIRFPRGWARVTTKELSVLQFDYELPILNPDWSIGGLSYIRRITANLFYDYGLLSRYQYQNGSVVGKYNTNISSYGVEITGDMNFLRFYAPVKIGWRTSYLPEIKDVSFDFLLSVDFNSL